MTLQLAAATLAAGVALPPTGPWVVEGQDNMCALSHQFGAGKQAVTLSIKPWPLGGRMDVLLFSHDAWEEVRHGMARITIGSAGRPITASYVSYALTGKDARLTTFTITEAQLSDFTAATSVSISFDRAKPVVVAPTGTLKAVTMLGQCNDLLLKSLTIDPSFKDSIATTAVPETSPSNWLRSADYPPTALQGGAQGRTSMLLTIGVDGRITRCVPFGSSGNAAMDKVSCDGLVRRGRYKPATGRDGAPMVSYLAERVNWLIPGH